jgi:4-azaleucine resistance transporter AzlC
MEGGAGVYSAVSMERCAGAIRDRPSALGPAFRASIPVLLGYVAIGLAFGLLLVESGKPWWLAPIMSVIVFAGAAQFMAVGLLASGTGIAQIAVLTFLINARHMVYGLSLLDRFASCKRFKAYLVFALTDETYGILTTVEPPEGVDREAYYAAVSALDQSYWVIGSTVGALVGGMLPFDAKGIDFALTALFIVLLVEQIRSVRRVAPYLVAAAAAIGALLLVGPANFLVVAILASIAGILPFRKALA